MDIAKTLKDAVDAGDLPAAQQLLPFYDPRAVAAFEKFERAVYSAL